MLKTLCLLAAAGLILTGCERKADNDDGADIAIAAPHEYTAAEKTAIQATFPAPYNTADLADGEKQFNKCRSCHTIGPDKMNVVGPHLYGVFGRKSGTEPGYSFTAAMTAHNVTWDFATLDAYLTAPQSVVKGTKMTYAGIKDDAQRYNLIAWMKLVSTPYTPPAETSAASDAASSH